VAPEVSRDAEPEGPPKLQRRPDLARPEPGAELPPAPAPGPLEGREATGDESLLFPKPDPAIAAAREAAEAFSENLPNFLVQQFTTRYVSRTVPAHWQAVDVVGVEVAVVDGTEQYRNVTINGKPSSRPAEKTGAWSTGEFVTTLRDLLSPWTNAAFVMRRQDRIANRNAVVYDFTVEQPNSNWRIIPERGEPCEPAYRGAIWIDAETHRVLRIERQARSIPDQFPFDKAEGTLDYDFVRIDGKLHLLPVRSENLLCQRGTPNCMRNEVEFRNYRKFAAESSISFEKQ
jgi:hypothetical protein